MKVDKKITLKTKLMYASGEICGGGAFLIISLLFMIYLTDVVHLSPLLAGTLFLVGKIWDAIIDPTIGYMTDHTVSRFGRRRIYFLACILPIFITYSLLWSSVSFKSQAALFVFYLLAYLLFNTVFSLVMIPYYAINADMTGDYKERTSLSGFRLIFSSSASILCGIVPKMIVDMFGGNEAKGYMVMGICFAALFALVWFIVFAGTWENKKYEKTEDGKSNIFKDVRTVFRNKSFRIHIGMFLSCMAAIDFISTLFAYFLTYCLNRPDEFSAVLGTLLVVQVVAMPVHMAISKKYDKTAPFRVGMVSWGLALILAFFVPQLEGKMIIYIVSILSGIGTSAAYLVPWSIIPELADVDEMISTKSRPGMYYGMVTFIRQLSLALTVFLIGVVLEWTGYVPNVEQSGMTKMMIQILFSIVPIVFIFLSIFFSTKYKMTDAKYKILKDEIARRRAGGIKEEVAAETKSVCEELTGLSYNKLWNENI